ncbi:MAG: hypothetical protein UX31_C0010G0010 [Candidatus Nomurabacteria bacterium GW2011_GWA1_46_11]|uniref:Uncharacterized protein n=2 Tax=Parcubacteria group TaxID=1794811 RepID=A0A1G1YUY0_9BACT|nr:MAG: hypothetical protein UX29_C0008G0030 [Parcubacteria group bacterium GW2011_GWA2_46_10]KKU21879.1 MAG: hypothetical protein UX31_C0010G0010 [Candidatus Nomurabacteria bacterium GW2011_GWA1_46_11]OGY56183.1 MAG: hypothetical protein A2119_00970 [Candidatus Colwellbacteria bacterium GWA2_46_10]
MKIDVEVHTGSNKARIEQAGSLFKAYLHSRPEKGKANKELIKAISEHFGVSESRVEILSGLRSKRKIVNIISI